MRLFWLGGSYTIFEYAQTLAYAPVSLFGQTIAQAALPILSREVNKPDEFKSTFATSLTQMFYLVLPISALLLVLRVPVVRLIYGAGLFDWPATVLTGRTLAFFILTTIAQSLITLVLRGFYALHDTKTPLIVGTVSTAAMIGLGAFFIMYQHQGVASLALASSLSSLLNLVVLLFILDKRVGGFHKHELFFSFGKIILATLFTGFALYIPIKLLDQLVIDTTYTINLLVLTGISSLTGLILYVFLTWLFNVKEATTFIHLFQRLGNWKEVLEKSDEVIDSTRIKP